MPGGSIVTLISVRPWFDIVFGACSTFAVSATLVPKRPLQPFSSIELDSCIIDGIGGRIDICVYIWVYILSAEA